MLTRFKVSGFKNLVDLDIRFGPFTCIAGPNAVGKSNLFDAIHFLSALADDSLMNAALSVRAAEGRSSDIRSLFRRIGDQHVDRITLEAEMILPTEAVDELGQAAEATITLVRYRLVIGYRRDPSLPTRGALELLREELERINLGEAGGLLAFPHSINPWRRSVLRGRRSSSFISTMVDEAGQRIVRLRQDGRQGRPKSFLAANLPRTILSTVNATESPTALVARREMQSWRLLQLEPSALRKPDAFTTPPGLLVDGSHLPVTLFHLARDAGEADPRDTFGGADSPRYQQVAARLSHLIDNVAAVGVRRDPLRELLTLELTERDGAVYPARSLSDGTLRFLALAVLEQDPGATGLIAMEEPENGIHPLRIPAIIRLLQDIACDVEAPVSSLNPLRQVIINTHSPAVVSHVPDDALLVADLKEGAREGVITRSARFDWLPDTWRAEKEPAADTVSREQLMAYLDPVGAWTTHRVEMSEQEDRRRRVADRSDLQLFLPLHLAPNPDD